MSHISRGELRMLSHFVSFRAGTLDESVTISLPVSEIVVDGEQFRPAHFYLKPSYGVVPESSFVSVGAENDSERLLYRGVMMELCGLFDLLNTRPLDSDEMWWHAATRASYLMRLRVTTTTGSTEFRGVLAIDFMVRSITKRIGE